MAALVLTNKQNYALLQPELRERLKKALEQGYKDLRDYYAKAGFTVDTEYFMGRGVRRHNTVGHVTCTPLHDLIEASNRSGFGGYKKEHILPPYVQYVMARRLIKSDIDLEMKDFLDRNVIAYAVSYSNEPIVRALLQAGCSPHGALYLAGEDDGAVAVIGLLLEAGADVNEVGPGYSKTPVDRVKSDIMLIEKWKDNDCLCQENLQALKAKLALLIKHKGVPYSDLPAYKKFLAQAPTLAKIAGAFAAMAVTARCLGY